MTMNVFQLNHTLR